MCGWANENNQGTTHNVVKRLARVVVVVLCVSVLVCLCCCVTVLTDSCQPEISLCAHFEFLGGLCVCVEGFVLCVL